MFRSSDQNEHLLCHLLTVASDTASRSASVGVCATRSKPAPNTVSPKLVGHTGDVRVALRSERVPGPSQRPVTWVIRGSASRYRSGHRSSHVPGQLSQVRPLSLVFQTERPL